MAKIFDEEEGFTQTMISDVRRNFKNDEQQVSNYFREIRDETLKDMLSYYPDCPREIAESVLKQNKWDVDKSIAPLWVALENWNEQKRRKEYQLKMEKKAEEEKQQQINELRSIFAAIPAETIQTVLKKHEGDMQLASEELFRMTAVANPNVVIDPKKEENRKREYMINALQKNFLNDPISLEDVEEAFNNAQSNPEKAHNLLEQLVLQRNAEKLQKTFPKEDPNRIQELLKQNQFKATTLILTRADFSEELEEPEQKKEEYIYTQQEEPLVDPHEVFGDCLLESLVLPKNKPEELPAPPIEAPAVDPVPDPVAAHPKENPEVTEAAPHFNVQLSIPSTTDVSVKGYFSSTYSEIECTYEIEGEFSPYDWIALVESSKPNSAYLAYHYVKTKSGSLKFNAPTKYGKYEVRYVRYADSSQVFRSNPIKVAPEFELKASMLENSVQVEWKQISGNTYSKSWIAMYYETEQNNANYLAWDYASKLQVSFPLPKRARNYVFRFFTVDNTHVGQSNVISIQGTDSVTCTLNPETATIAARVNVATLDPSQDSIGLALYLANEENKKKYRSWSNISAKESEVAVRFPKRDLEATYQLRLIDYSTWTVLAVSEPFTLPKTN